MIDITDAHATSEPQPTTPPGPGAARWFRALAAAFVVQVAAVAAFAGALIALIVGSSTNLFGGPQEPSSWGWLAAPLGILALVLLAMSGWAAARILRSRLGWLAILINPLLVTFVSLIGNAFVP